MKSFTNYVTEATEFKNTHLPHLEDLCLTPQGTQFAFSVLRQLGDMLHAGTVGALNVSVKWDGAPAVVFGPDPEDGQFFVATKSAFNQTPKLAKSHADIDALYPEKIRPVLRACFDKLSTLHPGIVLQGDVLFTPETLGTDADCWTFKPNTLKYHVPKDSELGHQIEQKALGIVLHTMYLGTGTSMQNLSGVPMNPETFAGLRQAPDVLVLDANYDDVSGASIFMAQEFADFLMALTAVDVAIDVNTRENGYRLAQRLGSELSRFINYCVRTGNPWTPQALVDFLFTRKETEAAARKTERGKSGVFAAYTSLIDDILQHGPAMTAFMALHAAVVKCKVLLVHKLASTIPVTATVEDANGERPTGPEGFVVTVGTTTVKLIDRNEFSRLNFTLPRQF